MKAVDFWNNVFTREQAKPNRQEGERRDSVWVDALEYFGDLRGRTLIDLGCGLGEASLFFANHGATVIAVDTAEVAVQGLRQLCEKRGIDNIRPMHMSALEIGKLPEVDCVFGSMILHHLEPFQSFCEALDKVLAPSGKAFFWENSAASPILMWFRRNIVGRFGVPKYGDDEEVPLTTTEVGVLKNKFHVTIQYPEFLAFRLASTYLLRNRAMSFFEWLDNRCYRIPAIRRFSYRQYLRIERAH